MKFEDLSIGAVIMHTDRKENHAHTGEMWLVTKFSFSKVEVICLNSSDPYRVGETGLILLKALPHYDLITTWCVLPATKPAEPKKDLWLRWSIANKTTLGKVGERTPYSDENGDYLCIGDTVKVKRGFLEFSDCLVVWDEKDDYYIMGIASDCDSRTGSTDDWELFKERSYTYLKNGDTSNKSSVEVVDFPPKGVGFAPKDLYLRWTFGKKTFLGKVGDKTPYKLKNGRNLFVGDIVKISKAGEEHCGCPVVRDRTFGYVIMGIVESCNDRTGNIDDWNVSLESPFCNRRKGSIADAGYGNFGVEVVDFLPEEKE